MSRRIARPREVDGQIAVRTEYYRKKLRSRVKGILEVDCPLDWSLDYMLNLLMFRGVFAICDSQIGVQAFRCGFKGINYRNDPTGVIIDVPLLKNMRKTIGEDCEIVYFERDMGGVFSNFTELCDITAEMLASVDAGIDVNIFNSKLAYAAEAETKAQADTIKDLYRRVSNGDPLVVYRSSTLTKGTGLQLFFNNLKNNWLVADMQDAKRTIYNEFDTAIGINNMNTDKKERQIVDEVNANNDEIENNVSHWRTNLKRCMERVHNMFPKLKLDMDFKFIRRMEEEANDIKERNRAMGDTSPRSKTS